MRLKYLLLIAILWGAQVEAQALTDGTIARIRVEPDTLGWQKAGVPGGIPHRTTSCSTVNPEGSSGTPVNQTDIDAAIVACSGSGGGVVNLAAGTFWLSNLIRLGNGSNVTLRGADGSQTFVNFRSCSSCGVTWGSSSISSRTVTWTSGFTRSTTSIGVSSVSGMVAGLTTLILEVCDTGFTAPPQSCHTGTTVDNGAVFTCTQNLAYCASQNANVGGDNHTQTVLVTNISGTTLTISPGLYYDFNSAASPVAVFNQNQTSMNGLEDMAVDGLGATMNNVIQMSFSYAPWMKGVRVTNGGIDAQLQTNEVMNCEVMNSYFYSAVLSTSPHPTNITTNFDGDCKYWNTIAQIGPGMELNGPTIGDVVAYNFWLDGDDRGGETNIGNDGFAHAPGNCFNLIEGNEGGNWQDDSVHGTKCFETANRNLFYANDPPYTKTSSIAALVFAGYDRFWNATGNLLGSATTTNYQSIPGSPQTNPVWIISSGSAFPIDQVTVNAGFRWGNCDAIHGFSAANCQFNSAEVPSALNTTIGFSQTLSPSPNGTTKTFTGTLANLPSLGFNNNIYDIANPGGASQTVTAVGHDNGTGTISGTGIAGSVNLTTGAVTVTFTAAPATGDLVSINYLQQTASPSAFQNPLPASHALSPSYFLTATAHPSGGTGIPFNQVCTAWATFPTCATYAPVSYPYGGPDVTGGNQFSGLGYDIPAAKAFAILPIDTSLQTAYTIASSSWAGGIETLNITGLPGPGHAIIGGMQITGTCSTGSNEVRITNSVAGSPTIVRYALASNPGACTGTILYPDVRQFSENVYANDPVVSTVTLSPSSNNFGSVVTGSSSSAVTFTLTNGTGSTITGITPTVGTAFSVTNTGAGSCSAAGGSLTASSSCTFTVTFTPVALGGASGTVSVASSDPASPVTASVSGTGTQQAGFAPTSISFGNVVQSVTSGRLTVTLTNLGTTSMTTLALSLTGTNAAQFAIAVPSSGTNCNTTSTLAGGASCVAAVTFTPNAVGPFSANLSFAASNVGSPQTVALTGTGLSGVVGAAGLILPPGFAWRDDIIGEWDWIRWKKIHHDIF